MLLKSFFELIYNIIPDPYRYHGQSRSREQSSRRERERERERGRRRKRSYSRSRSRLVTLSNPFDVGGEGRALLGVVKSQQNTTVHWK